MGCLVSFIFLFMIVMVLLSCASRFQSRADRWNRSYRELAQRYGGNLTPAGWFSRPRVRFPYASTEVRVSTLDLRRHGQYTQILIFWPDPKLRLEVLTRSRAAPHRPLKGMQELSLGVPDFDQQFKVFGTSLEEVRGFLSDGVQIQLRRLDRMLDIPGVYLGLQHGQLFFRKPQHLRDYRDLEEFAHLATQLYDQAMLSRAVGIKFVTECEPSNIAICQICGEEITTDMVFCRRCKTPHHHDCWKYYGSCAIYGCGEEKCVSPRLVRPPPRA